MDDLTKGFLAFAAGVVGLATIAVILSKNAQAPSVIQATGSAFSSIIAAAVAPVSSGSSLGSNPFSSII